jgi:hypothetical protein
MEPSHATILQSIDELKGSLIEYRTESRLRWEAIGERLDEHAEKLSAIPVVQHKLDENTKLTAAVLEQKSFWDGAKRRWIGLGMFAAAGAAMLGLWAAVKNVLQNGAGPHP